MSVSPADTVWKHGRFDARDRPREILFGRMYEDTSIEVGAFKPGSRVLCIASAGCTAMALASDHDVVAVDINPVQLAYAERRFAGDIGCRGSAERFMAVGRRFAPLVGWSPARVSEFLYLSDPGEQIAFWHRYLDTLRFRSAVDGFLSLTALRTVYASQFLDFLPPRLGAVLRSRMARCFARHSNIDNQYARSLLKGDILETPQAPAAQRIRLVHADAAAFLEREPAGSFAGFTLSNILDGADPGYERRLYAAVKHAGAPDATVILRSFSEPAQISSYNRAADDRAMLWGIVDVRPAASLP